MIRKTLLVGLLAVTAPVLGASEGEIGKLLDQRLNSENAAQAEAEQAAIAKGKRAAALTEGNAVLKDLETLQGTIERWEGQMKAILTSPEGQALASDPVSVQDFMTLQATKRLSLSQVDALRAQVQAVLAPIQAAGASSLYTPSAALVGEIQTVSDAGKKALADYDGLQAKWRVLVQRSKGVTPQGPTLAAVIEKVKDEQAARDLQAAQLARNQADSDAQRRLAEAEARKKKAETDARIQQMEDEQRRAETDRQMQRQEAERQKLVERAMNPATLSRFQPFLAKGHRVLRFDQCTYGSMVNPNITVLPYDIMKCGTLNDVQTFVRHANHPKNDRPKWKPPMTQADWAEMEKLLEEFRTYFPIWQEKGVFNR